MSSSSPAPDRDRDSPAPSNPRNKILLARPKPSTSADPSSSSGSGTVGLTGAPSYSHRSSRGSSSSSTGQPQGVISILKREPDPESDRDRHRHKSHSQLSQKSKDKGKLRIATGGVGSQNEKEEGNGKDTDKQSKDWSKGQQFYALVNSGSDSPSPNPVVEPSKILVGRKTITTKNVQAKPIQPEQPSSIFDLLQPYKFPESKAIPLIDSMMEFKATTEFMKQLKTSTDFLVVTVVGPKHSGKSLLLSYLANDAVKFNSEKYGVFEPRASKSERSTSFYITSDNILFIEMSPIFNGFSAIEFIPQVSQYGTLENAITSWNLRLMRFALVCSHLVIVVGTSAVDPVICQLVNSAFSVYPMESVFGEGCHPELIFVGNKLPLSGVQNDSLKKKLSHIMTTPDIIGVSRVPRVVPNVFLLPHTKYNYGGYENSHYENLKKTIMDFNRNVRNPFSTNDNLKFPQRTTLIDWFSFASRLWEELGSPAYFGDYVSVVNGQV